VDYSTEGVVATVKSGERFEGVQGQAGMSRNLAMTPFDLCKSVGHAELTIFELTFASIWAKLGNLDATNHKYTVHKQDPAPLGMDKPFKTMQNQRGYVSIYYSTPSYSMD